MNKKLIIITAVIGVLILSIFGVLSYVQNMMEALPKKAESFLYDNKDKLNEILEYCFENDIDYISDGKHHNKAVVKLYTVNGYYVYAHKDISDGDIKKLTEMLYLCKNNNITKIYPDIDSDDYGSFTMSYFLAATGIQYWEKPKPLEEIKEENYSENAWYVDDNWVIIEYD